MGIDPGIARLGWGVVEKSKSKKQKSKSRLKLLAYGCIKTKAGGEMPKRLLDIYRELRTLLRMYQPDLVAIEQLFFGANAKTAMVVGQARGVILLTVAQSKTPVVEFAPLEIKNHLSGYGRTKKPLMQAVVKKVLHLKEQLRSDDTADALAVAICAAYAD